VTRTALVVDDHAEIRPLLRQLMENCGFVVIGEAGNAAEALAAAEDLSPDVILLDVQLPDGTGIEVSRTISAWPTPPRIVLISTVDYGAATKACGAHAFILKGDLGTQSLLAVVD
jgi:CheY-like chemotaxis protein